MPTVRLESGKIRVTLEKLARPKSYKQLATGEHSLRNKESPLLPLLNDSCL